MDRLDKLVSVTELEDMTKDEWGIHLFAEATNQQMTKVAMELLATKDPSILGMKMKIIEVKSSIWCTGHSGKNYSKVAAPLYREKSTAPIATPGLTKLGTAGANVHTSLFDTFSEVGVGVGGWKI